MLFLSFSIPTAHNFFYFSSIVSPGDCPLTEEPADSTGQDLFFGEGAKKVKQKITDKVSNQPHTSSFSNPFSCESKPISFFSAAMFLSREINKAKLLIMQITICKEAVTIELKAELKAFQLGCYFNSNRLTSLS